MISHSTGSIHETKPFLIFWLRSLEQPMAAQVATFLMSQIFFVRLIWVCFLRHTPLLRKTAFMGRKVALSIAHPLEGIRTVSTVAGTRLVFVLFLDDIDKQGCRYPLRQSR